MRTDGAAIQSDEVVGGRLALTIGALGVVFGDIGTSPLYAFRIAVTAAGGPEPAIVLGILSLVFWSLTAVVTVKYIAVILRTDNHGEGGVLALAALLEAHRLAKPRPVLLGVAIIGAALLFGDAVITPAISVLSAMEGITVRWPALGAVELPVAVCVLVALYASQRLGTARIAGAFGPVMLVWFATLGLAGLIAIASEPSVLAALSPHHFIGFAARHPGLLLVVAGVVFLTVTGGEALYADLGQFGRGAISRAWLFIAMPCLVLNYFGQGALVLANPAALDHPFYLLFPPVLIAPMILLATAATVIASQAVITGIFSLTNQAIDLHLLPALRIRHTDHSSESHVYVPLVNRLLALLSIAITIAFGTSDALSSAYGISVAGAMVTTTILYIAYRCSHRCRYRLSLGACLLLFSPLLLLDLAFVFANLTKLASGGLVPLLLAGGCVVISWSWRSGLARMTELRIAQAKSLSKLLRRQRDTAPTTQRTGVFLTRNAAMAPLTMVTLIKQAGVKFARTVIVTVHTASSPRVPPDERLSIADLEPGVARVDVHVGYMQCVNLPALLGPAFERLGIRPDEVTYVAGLERPQAPQSIRSLRQVLLAVFALLSKLALRPPDYFSLPPTRTLEIGVPRQL